MKYRAKPIVVEAVRVSDLILSGKELEPWCLEVWELGKLTIRAESVLVTTPDGDQTAAYVDWIVRSADGTLSVYDAETFDASYEKVPSSALPWIDTYRKSKT